MTTQQSKDELLPCAKCGSMPMGSFKVEYSRGLPAAVLGTYYHCMGDDCEIESEPGDTDAESIALWNKLQQAEAPHS